MCSFLSEYMYLQHLYFGIKQKSQLPLKHHYKYLQEEKKF